MGFNGNAKLYYAENVKDLINDIEAAEGGDQSPVVITMLRTNRNVAVQKLRAMHDELDELVERADKCLGGEEGVYGSRKPDALVPDLCKSCGDALEQQLGVTEKAKWYKSLSAYDTRAVHDLLDVLQSVERGDRSPDVLAKLRANRNIFMLRITDIQEEADDLVARATRRLEGSSD